MALRFWRRIKLAPGVTLNLSKAGGSLSFGPRGAKMTAGSRGRRVSLGIPGTGLFYTKRIPAKTVHAPPDTPRTSAKRKKKISRKNRDEEAFIQACGCLKQGDTEGAKLHLKRSSASADTAYLAGFIALHENRLEDAEEYLKAAASQPAELGQQFGAYGIDASMHLPVTEHVTAVVGPRLRGVLLALVEIYQELGKWGDAASCLRKLQRMDPGDPVVRLSLAELLIEADPDGEKTAQQVAGFIGEVENDTEVHTALLYYKARACMTLGLHTAAREVLTYALRRRKDRPGELMKELRYLRGEVYEVLGEHARARSDYERIFAEDSEYPGIKERLNLG